MKTLCVHCQKNPPTTTAPTLHSFDKEGRLNGSQDAICETCVLWYPIEHAIRASGFPASMAGAFMYMHSQGDTFNYKHRMTRQYVSLKAGIVRPGDVVALRAALPALHCNACGSDHDLVEYLQWSQRLADAVCCV